MNKKASLGETLWNNTIYLIILMIFVVTIITYVWLQMNGAAIWSQYYSKEFTKVINFAKPGDEIALDIHKATKVAIDNDVPFEDIFKFDNSKNKLCIKLSPNRKTCYSYFNQVNIVEDEVRPTLKTNILTLKITEKQDENT
ncbi:MAG: hypothetical protein ABIG28_00240 [archaeon]